MCELNEADHYHIGFSAGFNRGYEAGIKDNAKIHELGKKPQPTLELCPLCGGKPKLAPMCHDLTVRAYLCENGHPILMPATATLHDDINAGEWNALVKAIRGISDWHDWHTGIKWIESLDEQDGMNIVSYILHRNKR